MASVGSYESRKGRRWRVQYFGPDGRRRQKRGFLTKREALAWAEDNAAEVRKGTWVDPQSGATTVGELAGVWLATRTHMKVSSRNLAEMTWRVHVAPVWEHVRIGEIKPSAVQGWVSSLSCSASSVRRIHSCLAQILDIAIRDRLLVSNPARGVSLPRKAKGRQVFLTIEQVRAVADRCGERGVIVWVLATTGIRWGELAALRVRDVDPARRRLHVRRAMVKDGSRRVIGEPKTHERRSVAVPRFVCNMLVPLLDGRGVDELIWEARCGGPMPAPGHRTWFSAAVDGAVADGEIPERITPHDLRHVAAGLLVSAGANVKVVQKQLGHASASMTLDVYASLFDGDLDEVADMLEAMHMDGDAPDVGALHAV